MATQRYAAIANVVVAGKRYSPGAAFSADPDDQDVVRQLRSQAMRVLNDDGQPQAPKAPRGRHRRRDMRASA